jgi:prepilin-type N-terminal cleavage/methylation domain-containing protein/prepilin-type processing-associated H-X9-DG protein
MAEENAMSSADTIRPRPRAFSLVELLVVIGIIGLLIAILLPTLRKVRRQATIVQCASNLHQAYLALQGYLVESRGVVFWRGADLSIDGMDWYVWGGRESGNVNTDQQNLFNRIKPRPLNPFVGDNINVFHCPNDEPETSPWTLGPSHFDWVGNSYNFNAAGMPSRGGADRTIGLAGVQFSTARDPTRLILFLDASLVYPGDWHGNLKGNICCADGHVAFGWAPRAVAGNEDFIWE